MNTTLIAIFSGVLLSLDQVLVKLFIDSNDFTKSTEWINYKSLLLAFIIFTIAIAGLSLWYFALSNSTLTNIYWTSSIYYISVPLLSTIILNESITKNQSIGYIIISLGSVIAASK